MPRTRCIIVALLAVVVLAAACGDEDAPREDAQTGGVAEGARRDTDQPGDATVRDRTEQEMRLAPLLAPSLHRRVWVTGSFGAQTSSASGTSRPKQKHKLTLRRPRTCPPRTPLNPQPTNSTRRRPAKIWSQHRTTTKT